MLPIAVEAGALQTLVATLIARDGQVPFTVDLQAETVSGPGCLCLVFSLPAAQRHALLEGLDDIGLTLQHLGLIEAWEQRRAPMA